MIRLGNPGRLGASSLVSQIQLTYHVGDLAFIESKTWLPIWVENNAAARTSAATPSLHIWSFPWLLGFWVVPRIS